MWLIDIKKKNVAWQKSAKKSDNRWHLTLLRNLTGDVKVVIFGKGPAISGQPDLIIDDRKQRSPKKDAASRKYINTSN